MELIISDYVSVWQKYNPFELALNAGHNALLDNPEEYYAAMLFGIPKRIRIMDEWYDVISINQLVRSKSDVDDKYHALYIQINMSTNEYYIGKVNRKRWGELQRYPGSGLKFKNKYKGHETEFVRYYFAVFDSQKEAEDEEARIVNEKLLKDPKCLNLVQGGGGTNEHYDTAKRSARQKEIMKEHPEFYESMVAKAKELYHSGDSFALRKRADAIKETMSDDYYRQMMSERIKRWRAENPEEYEKARENNRKAMQSPEVKEKRNMTRKKWRAEHPEEHKAQQEYLLQFRNSPEAREKRAESLKKWNEEHPEEARLNTLKRSIASVEKCRKAVNMCDLETGEVLRTFKSQHEAAQWLVEQGIAKNINCVSSINAVCQRKPCTTGYGYRKKAYGYDWQYADKD